MSTPRRVALLLAGLMTVLSFAAGCNVIGTAMYVFGPEPKRDPELVRLASDDKKKEVKVVIIASSGMETAGIGALSSSPIPPAGRSAP